MFEVCRMVLSLTGLLPNHFDPQKEKKEFSKPCGDIMDFYH